MKEARLPGFEGGNPDVRERNPFLDIHLADQLYMRHLR